MIIFLILIPILTLVSGLSLYRFNGRKEFLHFDTVQFVYAFIISPLLFLWIKSFVFSLLKTELGVHITLSELFLLDSVLSLFFLYIYAFVVIHSLTKSFKMRKLVDPLYDMFKHSEYFHLWLSHVVMFGGAMMMMMLFSFLNAVFHWQTELPRYILTVSLGLGIAFGIGTYIGALLSNPLQRNFMRLMKLLFASGFIFHIVVYFVIQPPLEAQHWLFWFCFMVFTTLIVCSLFWHRSDHATHFLEQLKDHKWGFNIDLSNKK